MIILICIIIFIFLAYDGACEADHIEERRKDYRDAERRHNEIVNAVKSRKKRTVRHIARDEKGRFVGEEITEEYSE